MCFLGQVFVIKAISSVLFYTFSYFKIYDFDNCWILAYKAEQGYYMNSDSIMCLLSSVIFSL